MTLPHPAAATAVLTGVGSARGIGRFTAGYLAERGWHLGLLAREEEQALGLAEEIRRVHGVRAHGVGADLTDPAAVDRAAGELESRLPQIIGLANLAGVSSPVPYLEVTPEEWDRVIVNNLTSTHLVTQRFARTMAERRLGRVIGLSSISAQRGGGTYSKTPYSAAKAGIEGLMRAVARELGPYGVTANTVSPGPVDTDIMGGTLSPERKAAMDAQTVLGRIADPRDVAATIAFLLSEDAGLITGQTLSVNAGQHMH